MPRTRSPAACHRAAASAPGSRTCRPASRPEAVHAIRVGFVAGLDDVFLIGAILRVRLGDPDAGADPQPRLRGRRGANAALVGSRGRRTWTDPSAEHNRRRPRPPRRRRSRLSRQGRRSTARRPERRPPRPGRIRSARPTGSSSSNARPRSAGCEQSREDRTRPRTSCRGLGDSPKISGGERDRSQPAAR